MRSGRVLLFTEAYVPPMSMSCGRLMNFSPSRIVLGATIYSHDLPIGLYIALSVKAVWPEASGFHKNCIIWCTGMAQRLFWARPSSVPACYGPRKSVPS